MSYKIAIASSDGIDIDQTFGGAAFFRIYEVQDGKYAQAECRSAGSYTESQIGVGGAGPGQAVEECHGGLNRGCQGESAGGCRESGGVPLKVELLSDCRCVVCQKMGRHVQREFERRAILTFDVDCMVQEALDRLVSYLDRVDAHRLLKPRIVGGGQEGSCQ